jgi:hypothetical protein
MILLLAVGFLMLLFVAPLILPLMPDRMRRLIVAGLALVCLLPYLLWKVLLPGAIDLTVTKTAVTYEFRSAEYAIEFATLNDKSLQDVSNYN